MDTELFELCKQVYEKTGWETDELLSHRGLVRVPLYTSDYLLEKLPRIYVGGMITLKRSRHNWDWLAGYDSMRFLSWQDDISPLKALLKLTVALADTNQLPPKGEQ